MTYTCFLPLCGSPFHSVGCVLWRTKVFSFHAVPGDWFVRKGRALFHSGCTILWPSAVVLCLYSHKHLVLPILSNFSHSVRCVVIHYSGFRLHLPHGQWTYSHVHIFHVGILFHEMCIPSFAHFLIGWFLYPLLSFESFSNIFLILVL